jgi:hypothetical protein
MKRFRNLATIGILALAGSLVTVAVVKQPPAAAVQPPPAQAPAAPRKIQVALLLDTSGSMNGLIDQARSQLWRIVNELAAARRDGQAATLEIALYEYGKSTVPAADGFVRRILPFTTDLDRVSEELFALATNGGDEYAGRAIQDAATGLEWSASPDDLKLLFIAGNESFDQGPVAPAVGIAHARGKGIRVNVIHCGGDDPTWRAGAAIAMGEYMTIDHNQRVVAIAAPQDAEIQRLGAELNRTYIAYGAHGRMAFARQEKQDANAVAAEQGAATQRMMSKASGAYKNSSWDLVDALEDGRVDLAKTEALPEEMKAMTLEQRKAHVAAAAGKRKELQARIRALSAERETFVQEESKRQGLEAGNTLDAALLKAVRVQAEKSGYAFKK